MPKIIRCGRCGHKSAAPTTFPSNCPKCGKVFRGVKRKDPEKDHCVPGDNNAGPSPRDDKEGQPIEDSLAMLRDQHAAARDAIYAQPESVIRVFEDGERTFNMAGAVLGNEYSSTQGGITRQQLEDVERYVFTMAFIAAWYDLEDDNTRRDKLVGSACIIGAAPGGRPPAEVLTELVSYSVGWRRVLQPVLRQEGLRLRRPGCAASVLLLVSIVLLSIWRTIT